MANRTKARSKSKLQKPEKPHPEFPLFPHARAAGQQSRGTLPSYFGSSANGPEATLQRFNPEWPGSPDESRQTSLPAQIWHGLPTDV